VLAAGSAASIPVKPVRSRGDPREPATELERVAYEADSAEPAPFTRPISLGATQRELSPLPFAVPSQIAIAARDVPSSPAAPSGHEWPDEPPNPVAGAAAAPPAPISPAFTGASSEPQAFDTATIRNDFPNLQEKIHGRRLIWLDNGATTQKPQAVIDRLAAFYAHENSNVHRGAHTLAARATDAYEAARDKVRRFVGASSPNEIVFVRGTTEGINLVAQAWGRRNVKAGDEIVVTCSSITPTSFPGSNCVSRRGRGSASHPSMTKATSCSTNTKGYSARAPVSSRCRRSRTRLARSRPRAR
jgi:cysteine desulfurase/selenocysteine lyase